MIRLTVSSFMIHKEAESLEDCQDAYAQNDGRRRYAIADGATRSFFPKEWATLLVEHFCDGVDYSLDELRETKWQDWISPIQDKWYEQVKQKVIERNFFYLTNSFNAKEPAVSTFIGIEFSKNNDEWTAMIVGDSCLFHKSESEFVSYPIKNPADFTNQPEVFASFAKDNYSEPLFESGRAKPGDIFILASDALAKWILENNEAGKLDLALDTLQAIGDDEEFRKFVDAARYHEAIRLVNDDVTLLLISVDDGHKQSNDKRTEHRPSSEDAKLQTKLLRVLLLTLVSVSLGIAAFCYLLYLFDLFFRD